MTSNAIHGVSFRLKVWAQVKYSVFCIQHIYFVMSDGPCWETKYHITDLEPSPFMSPSHICTSVFKFTWSQTLACLGVYWGGFLQTQTRQWWMEDVNKRCGNIRSDSSTASACSRRGVNAPACSVEEPWTVSKPDAASQHNRSSLSTGHLNFES